MATLWQHEGKGSVSERTRDAVSAARRREQPAFGWWRAALTALPFAGLWWLFAGGNSSWVVGIPCILLAAGMAGLTDEDTSPVCLSRLPGFFFWFLVQSVRGGIDVARRALTPSLPMAPGLFTRRTALPSNARPWLANTMTLLPGTLAAHLDGDRIDIHAIERSPAVEAEVRRAEARIAALIEDGSEDARP